MDEVVKLITVVVMVITVNLPPTNTTSTMTLYQVVEEGVQLPDMDVDQVVHLASATLVRTNEINCYIL